MTNLLLAQVETMDTTHSTKSVFSLLGDADPLVKFTLFVLITFSILSWAIIFFKFFQLKKIQRNCQKFWRTFGQSQSLTELSKSKIPHQGSLFDIFNGTLEYYARIKTKYPNQTTLVTFIEQRITQLRESQILKLEQYTTFLATTASTAPFIGLFGTVWGILTAFWAIGDKGSSSLATVGPYISEALIVTAVGLLVAIPSVLAFNYFTRKIKVLVKLMNLFSAEFILKLKEELIKQ
jgi:biopolymer transport protein TolQ